VSTFLPAADMSFYIALSPAAPSSLITSSFSNSSTGEEGGGENHPLVSCIMPTYNRRAFVPQAIAYFLRQDYANKELIIVDDGIDAVGDLVPADQHIRYIRLSQKTTLGVKRNIACEQARGTIIAHWDDDDWHAPHRLRYQVHRAGMPRRAVRRGPNPQRHPAEPWHVDPDRRPHPRFRRSAGRTPPNYEDYIPAGVVTARCGISEAIAAHPQTSDFAEGFT